MTILLAENELRVLDEYTKKIVALSEDPEVIKEGNIKLKESRIQMDDFSNAYARFCVDGNQEEDRCENILGASIIADDGTYLGKINQSMQKDSIFNKFGTYGNKFSSNSIWNEFGTYGGKFSTQSPFNKFTTTPPVLYLKGGGTMILSINKSLENSINPYFAAACFD